MVTTVAWGDRFQKRYKKLDKSLKEKIRTQIKKILNNPDIWKPMKYGRKGTLELYVSPFRLSYIYEKKEDKVVLLEFYHKDEQ